MLLQSALERLSRIVTQGSTGAFALVRIVTLSSALTLFLGAGTPATATATIISISSDWCRSCPPGAVHRIVAGKQTSMVVKGQFVDLSTRVEITGSGVSVSFGDRTHGSDSSIVVRFDVDNAAALGERTVKLRYLVETSGPDTFKVQVVRGGRIDRIEQIVAGIAIPANAIPVNQRVTLAFTGTRIGNASLSTNSAIRNPRILSNSETRCDVELEFTRTGAINVNLVDADVGPQPHDLLFRFFYDGAKQVTVVGESSSPTTGAVTPGPITSGGSASATFADVAPRANMLNLFRRIGNPITINGQAFVPVEDRWCSENGVQTPAAGSNSRLITVPDIQWGVSNVGTAEINVAFNSQLLSNNQILQTQTIAAGTLHPGATQNFAFTRTRNRVRVIRFAPPNQPGCFVNPRDTDSFFEDPPFTVRVDVGNVVPEAATNRANNSRNY
jgi:hypothetical protein